MELRHHHAGAQPGGRRGRHPRTSPLRNPSCSKAWIPICFGTACWIDPSASSAWITFTLPPAARSASIPIPTWAISTTTSSPPASSPRALKRDELVVYDVRGPRLRNITDVYAAMPRDTKLPLHVDAASPLTSYLLGPEWYQSDGDHRWMPRRATLRIGAPSAARPEALSTRQLPRRTTPRRPTSRHRNRGRRDPAARHNPPRR